jgi:signal transduction histidine kinase
MFSLFNSQNRKTNSEVSSEELAIKEQQIERSQDEFLSIASHELRTPITVIKGNASLIKQYYWQQLPNDEVRAMITDMYDSSNKMIELINNFMDTLRLEQKFVKFETHFFDLAELARAVVAAHQDRVNPGVKLEFKEQTAPIIQVIADRAWTKRALDNIVENAIKFTNKGSISVSVTQEGANVKLFVADTGSGISHDAQKLIFHKFAQTNENVLTRDTVQGTGLGLYMCKLIMEQMNGNVRLESSQPNHGSNFSITLPVFKH